MKRRLPVVVLGIITISIISIGAALLAGSGTHPGPAARSAPAAARPDGISAGASGTAPSAVQVDGPRGTTATAGGGVATSGRFHGEFWGTGADEDVADRLMATMSDEEIVAQCFLVGWPTENPAPGIMSWIRTRDIGGVKVFGWNANDPATMMRTIGTFQTAALATRHGIPLFVATDQEGGEVRHIRGNTSVTPGNMAIGASALPYDAYRTGYYIGTELRAMGVNMNFAPTVDVTENPKDRVIGSRAFSSDPVQVGMLGIAFFRGLDETRVISTAKHFPGHGNAEGDSHGMLPVINDSFDTVWNRDLIPYRMMIPEGLPAILGGHLNFPLITGDDAPASLSPFFKTEVMRDRLGFHGIVITDDMYMVGATIYADRHHMTFGELCLAALMAGNDMIMLSQTPGLNDEIWTTIYGAYERDAKARASIRQSVRRILLIKMRYLKPENRVPFVPDVSRLTASVPNPQGTEFFRNQAARSVTIIAGDDIPFMPKKGERILLAGNDQDFLAQGKLAYPTADEIFFNSIADERALDRAAARHDVVIFCLSYPFSLDLLNSLKDSGAHVIVYSILTPIYLRQAPWVQSAIAVYGWGVESFQAGFSALTGSYVPEGRLPISVAPMGTLMAGDARSTERAP